MAAGNGVKIMAHIINKSIYITRTPDLNKEKRNNE